MTQQEPSGDRWLLVRQCTELKEDSMAQFYEGQRVAFIAPYDNYPDVWVDVCETGTIDSISESAVWVTLDAYHPTLKQWDNQAAIYFERVPEDYLVPYEPKNAFAQRQALRALTDEEVHEAVDAAFNALCGVVQRALNIKTGDCAGQWAADDELITSMIKIVRDYEETERDMQKA